MHSYHSLIKNAADPQKRQFWQGIKMRQGDLLHFMPSIFQTGQQIEFREVVWQGTTAIANRLITGKIVKVCPKSFRLKVEKIEGYSDDLKVGEVVLRHIKKIKKCKVLSVK